MKKKTALLRRQIITKFGNISRFERAAGVKKHEIHTALSRIDRSEGKYKTVGKMDEDHIKLLMSMTQPKNEMHLGERQASVIRKRIAVHYGNLSKFIEATGFRRGRLYETLRGVRRADDLIKILDEKDQQSGHPTN